MTRTVILTGTAAPPAANLPQIVTAGAFFALSSGEPWTAIEASDFNLLARYDLEGATAIRPVLEQRASLGYNLLRVWTAFDIPGIGVYPICAYSKIPAFVALCASYGLYVEFTGYTGINDPLHWPNLIAAALPCHPYPLLELVNELDQNTNEPDDWGRTFHLEDYAQPPAPLLSCHGSNGAGSWPVEPVWSYAAYHSNGLSEWMRKVGHESMEIASQYGVPCLANENTRFPDNDDSVQHAYDAAAGAALLCGGSCFHSVNGKTSQLWTGQELACAEAWAAGAKSVPLSCQPGPYTHRGDLEGPEDLRVYQRGDDSACIVEIRI